MIVGPLLAKCFVLLESNLIVPPSRLRASASPTFKRMPDPFLLNQLAHKIFGLKFAIPRINHKRHRTVILRLDLHVRAKAARGHGLTESNLQALDKASIERFCLLWISRPVEGRTIPLLQASVERKLADNQRFAIDLNQTLIHAPRRRLKDAESRQPPDQPLKIVFGIITADTKKDKQARTDCSNRSTFHFNPG